MKLQRILQLARRGNSLTLSIPSRSSTSLLLPTLSTQSRSITYSRERFARRKIKNPLTGIPKELTHAANPSSDPVLVLRNGIALNSTGVAYRAFKECELRDAEAEEQQQSNIARLSSEDIESLFNMINSANPNFIKALSGGLSTAEELERIASVISNSGNQVPEQAWSFVIESWLKQDSIVRGISLAREPVEEGQETDGEVMDMQHRDAVVRGLAFSGYSEAALNVLLHGMLSPGLVPSKEAFVGVVKALS
ncbi:hypothetical protein HDU76_008178, partial [Blyttiomyces sp. JEL0837]